MADYRGKNAADFDFEALPPEEAIGFFRRKGYRVGFDYRDVWQAEHARAFTVAKAMTVDLLQDIRLVVDKAIADGIDFKDFRSNLEPILRARGWWGRQKMTDPLTGRKREVQLGSVRRLDVIYDTNLRSSLNAGHWQQIQRTKADLPYLEYEDPDPNPRPQHLDWSGTVLPVDDPWWDTHYPANGWYCKCEANAVSAAELRRRGKEPNPVAPPSPTYTYTNPRTGKSYDVPEGVDPAFAYNVGKTGIVAPARQALDAKLATADPMIARAVRVQLARRPHKPTLDEAIATGRGVLEELGPAPKAGAWDMDIRRWRKSLNGLLRARTGRRGVLSIRGTSASGADRVAAGYVRKVSDFYPGKWVRASNGFKEAPLVASYSSGRGYYDFAAGEISTDNLRTATHELGHRFQQAMPELQEYFQALHDRRTLGEETRPLAELDPNSGYDVTERGQRDKYVRVYFGKVYAPGRHTGQGGALEVMTMAYQAILGGGFEDSVSHRELDSDLLSSMVEADPELASLAVGLLFSYAP